MGADRIFRRRSPSPEVAAAREPPDGLLKETFGRPGSPWIPAAAVFALLVAAAFADPLLTGRVFSGRDLVAYNHPMENAIHGAWAAGRLPVWMSEVSGGRPLAANPNAGALYPVRPLLAFLSFPAAIRLFPILHWILAGWGMLWLAKRIGVSAQAAWIGAATYVFSGVGVSEVFFPNVHPGMALLPWIVGVVIGGEGTYLRTVFPLSLLFALDMLAGDVFTVGVALLCALTAIATEIPARLRRRSLAALALAIGIACLAALPQLLATLLWIPETNRAVLGIRLGEAFAFSLSPWRLLELIVPYPFGDTWRLDHQAVWGWTIFHGKALGIFGSIHAGAFAVIAGVLVWRSREKGARLARVLLLLGLLLAVPPSLLPDGWSKLPAPVALRNPEKFAVLIVFALAVFAARGVEAFRSGRRLPRWALAAGACLAAAALYAAVAPVPAGAAAVRAVGGDPLLARIAAARLPGALAEGGLLWMGAAIGATLLAAPVRAARVAGLCLLTLLPLGATRRIARTFRVEETIGPTLFARRLEALDPAGEYRVLGESLFLPPSPLGDSPAQTDVAYIDFARRSWYQHTHALWGRGTVVNFDFDAGDFSRIESVRRLAKAASRFTDSQNFFGSLALRWGIRYRDQPALAGYVPFGGDALQAWDRHEGALPEVRLLERWRECGEATEALGAVSGLPAGSVVLETGRSAAGSSRPGRVTALERTPERCRFEVEALDPGWLFLLRPFWRFRRIELNGRRVEAVPAQLAFTAIPVPAGRHRVEWREEIPGWRVSRFGPLLFVALSAALAARKRER